MKIRMMACLAAGLMLGAAVPAAAQDARGGGSATRSMERLAERSPVRQILGEAAALGLTREQVRALEAVDRELSARADSAVGALRAAEARAAAGADGGSRTGPGQRMRESRAAVLRAQGEAAQQAWAILTPEQRERFRRSAAAPE
jgi:hypothetical protein